MFIDKARAFWQGLKIEGMVVGLLYFAFFWASGPKNKREANNTTLEKRLLSIGSFFFFFCPSSICRFQICLLSMYSLLCFQIYYLIRIWTLLLNFATILHHQMPIENICLAHYLGTRTYPCCRKTMPKSTIEANWWWCTTKKLWTNVSPTSL